MKDLKLVSLITAGLVGLTSLVGCASRNKPIDDLFKIEITGFTEQRKEEIRTFQHFRAVQKSNDSGQYWNALRNLEYVDCVFEEYDLQNIWDFDRYKIELERGNAYLGIGIYNLAWDAYIKAFHEKNTQEVRDKLSEVCLMMAQQKEPWKPAFEPIKVLYEPLPEEVRDFLEKRNIHVNSNKRIKGYKKVLGEL